MGYENVNFPKGTTFLVTGAAGFIGSNLCEAILKKGCIVRGLDNLSTGKLENLDDFKSDPNFTFIQGDIRDLDTCMSCCDGVDYVLHQAAWGSVPRSIEMPLLYEEINIKGTLNMLEAARQKKVKRFVYASSSSVYGDEPNLPKVEGREGNLLSPYALTKRVNEEYAKQYSMHYGLETIGLRYFNVFGKRQNPEGAYAAVIPKWINELINHEIPTINGDGTQSRDFTYIENVVEANLKSCIADSASSGKSFNIAFGGQETLRNVLSFIMESIGVQIAPRYTSIRKGDIKHSNANISLATTYLNYSPTISFKDGIHMSIKWYKSIVHND